MPLTQQGNVSESWELLKALAEELKLPLMHISRGVELAEITSSAIPATLVDVQLTADSALDSIDSYILGLQLASQQQVLALEPVSLKSALYEAAHKLDKVAKRYNISLELDLLPAQRPVMANQAGLSAALLSLGTAFIESQAGQSQEVIVMATHSTRNGLAAGLYSAGCNISTAQLRQANSFYGKMRQPFNALSAGSAAGIFVAQQVLQAMAANLRVTKHNKQSGLAAVLQPSQQLSLIQ